MITQDLFAPNPWPGDRGLDAIDITIMTLEGPTPTPKPTRTPKPTPTPTMTPKPTHTPRPTPTPRPTRTPRPTSTPKPTLTPMPTMTPKPTFTPVPTPTPTMTPKPTPTPIPTTTPSPTPPPIIGPLWNFDLHNFTNSPVNDMEMILFDVNPKDIKEFYIGGWGPPFDKLIGTWLEWKSKYPLMPGEYSHFGISVDPIAQPDIMEVTWTRDGRPVNINYMPIHQWVADRDLVIHIIINPYYGTPRLIQRSWAVAPFSLPLDDMHRNNPALNKLPWEWEKPFILEPGGKSPELIIPNETNDPIFVRYDVMDSVVGPIADETIHGAFINQIIFGAGAAPILETLNNFDLLNNTKYPVNDLHIFLRKTEPQNIRNFYTGGWGKPYVMRKAIKLIWKGKEILPCNYVHFGLRIAAGVIQPTVRMIIWTYNGQPVGSIPFPWMKWDASRPGVVKSVITAPANPEIVTVDRRIAQGPFVPLKLLDKDSEPIQAMTWAHLRGDPVRVGRPGPILMDPFFDIFFDLAPNPRGVTGGPYFASLILDYTVRRSPDKETTPSLRMISEFDYKSGSTLFNFDVWNESDSPINDLELFLDGATTESILYAAGDWGKIEDLKDGVVVSYDRSARWEPAKPADFNLALKGRTQPMLVQSVLTLDGKEVAPISIPWNIMSASLSRQFSSILRLPDSCSEPVVVKREYAFAKTPFLIEELNSLNPSIEMLSWEKVEGDPIKVLPHIPSDPLELNIPKSAKAVLLRYSVWNFDGKHIANILTQAVLADDIIGADILVSEQHTNIQIGAVPTTANGLILAFKEISRSDVLAAPQPFWFTDGLIRPASYIVWANPRGVLPPGESAHFGLILAPQHDGNTVFARSLKTTFAGVPINEQPIPWPRFNMWDELEQAIIHNAPICLDEIWVSARFGRADVFLPIENLKPNDPLFEVINFITLEGEPEVEADIPVSGNNSSAFIQYDVNRIGGDKPVVIFTNEYATTPTINIPPQLSFILPANEEEITSGTYTIKWIDSDPDDDAEISLYFDEDNTGFDGTPIVTGLSEDDEENQYVWDTARLAEGIYYIYGIINDGVNPPVMVYAKGSIKITRVSDEDIADHILNRRVLAPERLKLADLNNDGKIDVADLICTFVKRK
ncbi:MAG TPA: hypothetical protein PKW18_04260 [Candidatus Sumerlaeota bacterium]|nr:hypothetical protein [Candidatus Sumerlaeota bacterium]